MMYLSVFYENLFIQSYLFGSHSQQPTDFLPTKLMVLALQLPQNHVIPINRQSFCSQYFMQMYYLYLKPPNIFEEKATLLVISC